MGLGTTPEARDPPGMLHPKHYVKELLLRFLIQALKIE